MPRNGDKLWFFTYYNKKLPALTHCHYIRCVDQNQNKINIYKLNSRQEQKYLVRFQVLAAARVKMTVLWEIAPCSLVENDELLSFYKTTRRNVPQDRHLQLKYIFAYVTHVISKYVPSSSVPYSNCEVKIYE
jgi:hypothetical protein